MLIPEIIDIGPDMLKYCLKKRGPLSYESVRPMIVTQTNSESTAGARYVIGQAVANYSTGVHSACELK